MEKNENEQCGEGSCGSGCGCGQANCGCGESASCASECGSGCGEWDRVRMLMYLAKEAKAELLREKMKKKLEATHGKKYDQIADLIVEALTKKMQVGAEEQQRSEELRDKIDAIYEQ